MSRRAELSVSYRLSVLSRIVAAAIGGYALMTMLSILLSQVMPMSRAKSVGTAMLLSFAIYVGAVLWVFAARTACRAWGGVMLATLVCGVASWLIRAGG